jgi:hypothetical protein
MDYSYEIANTFACAVAESVLIALQRATLDGSPWQLNRLGKAKFARHALIRNRLPP